MTASTRGLLADAVSYGGHGCDIDETEHTAVEVKLTAPLGDRELRDGFIMTDPHSD